MSVTIKEAIDAYILSQKKSRSKFSETTLTNLLISNDKNKDAEKNYSFLCQDSLNPEMLLTALDTEEYIDIAIKSSLKKYVNNKFSAVTIYKDFIAFINKKYAVHISILFPKWLPKTTLESQLYIAKALQDPEVTLAQLEDTLYVSSKTLSKYLNPLKEDTDDPIEVMGQRLTVDFNRSKGKITFHSTLHPLFLTFNLTQVITTLEGLKLMSEREAYKNYAVNSAKTIWLQLSDYAKHRIFKVSKGLGIDVSWYKSLETDVNKLFYSESMCSTSSGSESLLLCFKNSRPCFIEYIDNKGETVIYKNCLIKDCPEGTVTVDISGEQLVLETSRVVKAALSENELY